MNQAELSYIAETGLNIVLDFNDDLIDVHNKDGYVLTTKMNAGFGYENDILFSLKKNINLHVFSNNADKWQAELVSVEIDGELVKVDLPITRIFGTPRNINLKKLNHASDWNEIMSVLEEIEQLDGGVDVVLGENYTRIRTCISKPRIIDVEHARSNYDPAFGNDRKGLTIGAVNEFLDLKYPNVY